jgi:hypothetical protein
MNVTRLRQCVVSYEVHPNGWLDQWPPSFWINLPNGIQANQYGRTSFLFAGVTADAGVTNQPAIRPA